jgi:thioredoxin 1
MILKDYLETDEAIKILLFTASWCSPCKKLKEILKKLPKNYNEGVNIYQVDVEKEINLANKFEIRSIPTLLFMKNNKIKERLVGTTNEDLLIETISKLIY